MSGIPLKEGESVKVLLKEVFYLYEECLFRLNRIRELKITGENYFIDDEVYEMIDKLCVSLQVNHKYVTTLESMKKGEFYDITHTSSTSIDSSSPFSGSTTPYEFSPSFSTSPTPYDSSPRFSGSSTPYDFSPFSSE